MTGGDNLLAITFHYAIVTATYIPRYVGSVTDDVDVVPKNRGTGIHEGQNRKLGIGGKSK